MALSIEKYSTNDEIIESLLFSCKGEYRVQSFVFRQLSAGAGLSFFRYAARYLVKKVKPEEAKTLLNKYIVVLVYNYLLNKEILVDDLICDPLRNIFTEGISIENLSQEYNSESPFMTLFNCKIKEYNKTINDIKFKIIEKFRNKIGASTLDKVFFALYNFYDYFQVKTDFTKYDDSRRSCDLLIAEALTYNKNRKFTFEIMNEDEFNDNVITYQYDEFGKEIEPSKSFISKTLPQRLRNAQLIFAHLINDSLVNDISIDKIQSINSSELKCYTLDPSASYSSQGEDRLTFIKSFYYDNGGYYLDLDNLHPFEFKYNQQLYKLTNSGIIKL